MLDPMGGRAQTLEVDTSKRSMMNQASPMNIKNMRDTNRRNFMTKGGPPTLH